MQHRILDMTSKSNTVNYASIAIIEFCENEILVEAISVTEDICDLSGAWNFDHENLEKIKNVLGNKLLILIGEKKKLPNSLREFENKLVSIQDFLDQAKYEAKKALQLYEEFHEKNEKEYLEYMQVKPAERKLLPKVTKKKLIAPIFYDWPDSINLDEAEKELTRLGKLSKIEGTPNEMRKILAAARLVQILIKFWINDENERLNRQYVTEEMAKVTILPPPWLKQVS